MKIRGTLSWPQLLILSAVAVTFIGLVLLGNWQMRRMDWKLELIERIESRVGAAPIGAPSKAEWHAINRRDHEYLRVTLRGQFLHQHQTLVQALTELGGGYWVLTPLITPAGEVVLINRGFVPLEAKKYFETGVAEAPAETQVTGLLRINEPDGIPLRSNDPEAGRWYSRDVHAIARARGLTGVAPFFIDAEKGPDSEGLPIAGMTRLVFRNTHLVYALTWYALALLLLIMTLHAIYRERSERKEDWRRASDSSE